MSGRLAVFRVDAGHRIGAGHAMRCLALAQAWQDRGGRALFVCAALPENLRDLFFSEDISIAAVSEVPGSLEDARATARQASHRQASLVVVDGYVFGREFQAELCRQDPATLVIDDHGHAGRYFADVILDQNLGADPLRYRHRPRDARLLLGSEYALLRRMFRDARPAAPAPSGVASNLLVTLGGGDTKEFNLRIVHALKRLDASDLRTIIVAGAAAPSLRRQTRAMRSIEVKAHVVDMPALMAWADVAVSAGGSTCWEMAYMGLPNLILVLADNQRRIAEQLQAAGVSHNIGDARRLDPPAIAAALDGLIHHRTIRHSMATSGQALIDGRGAERVLDCLPAPV